MSRASCLPAPQATPAPEFRVRDIDAKRVANAPTAPGYDREFEEMRHGTTGNVELVGMVTLLPTSREPVWTFAADADGEAVAGGRVNAILPSDALIEVAKVLANDELNGSGKLAGSAVVTLVRL